MYNGQFFKGLIHVVIFAVLVSMAHISGIFGIFIPAWILYQSFEAFHTAKALRDGMPVPDPLGLNEVGNWLNLGKHTPYQNQPYQNQPYSNQPNPGRPPVNPTGTGATSTSDPSQPPIAGAYQPPYTQTAYQAPPYQTPYQAPQAGAWQIPYAPPAAGPVDPGAPPAAIPPDPSAYWRPIFGRNKAPIGAIILIALGVLFLLGQMDIFNGRLIEYSWPVFLIGLGVWLVIRRLGDSQGGPK
jgi:hypothetical protein